MSVLMHLVYIHGFQGNDTTFQSFPKDLQEYISLKVPAHLDIKIRTSLYPTYKSAKPISYATKNFLEWLSTQPPGPVILLGHSMGGLLASEAATDPSNNRTKKGKRIVGVIAFDTPYLGMHPHVVVSGIASLLPGEQGDKERSEESMNEHPQVKVVDEKVTDDWEAFKKENVVRPRLGAPYPSDSGSVLLSAKSETSALARRSPSPSSVTERAVSYIAAHSDAPIGRWLQKHADDPFSAGKRWVVERFQFGSSMFNPSGLKQRYERFVLWDGLWVNYWTTTPPDGRALGTDEEALRANGILGSEAQGTKKPKKEEKARVKQWLASLSDNNGETPKSGRHFVVLPNGLGSVLGGMEKWENVQIAGAEDEVNAHTGLFIPRLNLGYNTLVEKVAHRILTWCDQIPLAEYTKKAELN